MDVIILAFLVLWDKNIIDKEYNNIFKISNCHEGLHIVKFIFMLYKFLWDIHFYDINLCSNIWNNSFSLDTVKEAILSQLSKYVVTKMTNIRI